MVKIFGDKPYALRHESKLLEHFNVLNFVRNDKHLKYA